MGNKKIREAIIESLETEGITGVNAQSKYLGISNQVFKEQFLKDTEISPIVAKRAINSLIKKIKSDTIEKNSIEVRKELMNSFIDSLNSLFGDKFYSATGFNQQTEKNWREGKTKPQLSKLNEIMNKIDNYYNQLFSEKNKELVNCIYNFERIYPDKVDKKVWRLHVQRDKSELKEIKDNLSKKIGLYLLYDSSGRLVYVGKTEKQDLYSEIVQRIRDKKIKLILRNQKREEKLLGEIAQYLTCYEIKEKSLISSLEAMLIGADPNTTSNIKMEK